MPDIKKPLLKVSVLSDYICPFCFIGHKRLEALREHYELRINWCFIEIHPETPAEGYDVAMLNYSEEYWDSLMKNLFQLAKEENIELSPQTITTNSRRALLLAEASKSLGAEFFIPCMREFLMPTLSRARTSAMNRYCAIWQRSVTFPSRSLKQPGVIPIAAAPGTSHRNHY